jgi:hypothetical protein
MRVQGMREVDGGGVLFVALQAARCRVESETAIESKTESLEQNE